MSLQNCSPFDQLVLSHGTSVLRFVISTDYSVIMNMSEEVLYKIIQCNLFKEINVVFSPTTDKNVIQRIKTLNGQPSTLIRKGTEIYLNDLFLCCFDKNSDLYQYDSSSGMRLIDIFCNLYTEDNSCFDYFVTSQEDKSRLKESKNIIGIDDVLEYIRLYFLQQESFFVTPNFKIDETMYYMYRPRKIFLEYQRLWDYVITHEGIASSLANWSCSLINRLEFFCRSSDALKIESLKRSSNKTNGRIRHHLFELIICTTGIFDNLAWIVVSYFSIDIDKRRVSLHQPQSEKDAADSKKSEFIKVLYKEAHEIANYLCERHVKEFIRLVYPLRDAFVHQEAPESCTLSSESQSSSKSLIQLSSNASEKFSQLEKAGVPCSQCTLQLGSHTYLLIYPFVEFVERHLSETVNTLLRLLPIDNTQKLKRPFEEIDNCSLFI